MSKLTIELLNCRDVDATVRHAVEDVFYASFASNNQNNALEPYFRNVRQLLLARDGRQVVGFQFYQMREVAGCQVRHFSLAGRRDDKRYRGLQARFGRLLIRQAMLCTPPWSPVYLAGVTNNPKSYANFHAVGGKCFPNIPHPGENPFGAWYGQVAQQLGMEGVDDRGLLRHRMQGIGFGLKDEPNSRHPMAQAYDRYVEGNRDHGVFTLIELLPLRDLPGYVMRQLFKRPREAGKGEST